jgi:hypothetical protein
MRHHRKYRSAFTIVELLVAAALSMVIMLIIGICFQKSIDTFRTLRSVSQLQEKLKSAHLVLKRDLEAEHFGNTGVPAFNGVKLSQQRLDLTGWAPPTEGFFCIMQGTTGIVEGNDSDLVPATRAVTHSLHFTSRLIADPAVTTVGREEDYFYAFAPPLAALTPIDFQRPVGTIFASRWAEIMYFLVPNGANANGEPLFALYRRQRLLLPLGSAPVGWSSALEQSFPNVSWSTTAQTVNATTDIPVRANRMQAYPVPQPNGFDATGNYVYGYGNIWRNYRQNPLEWPGINPAVVGDDILLTDVLSFEVKAYWTAGTASMPFEINASCDNLATAVVNNPDWPYDYLPSGGAINPHNSQYNDTNYATRTFDTWSATDLLSGSPPLRICIKSLQFRVRVWDQAGQAARQITIVQDM